MKPYWQNQEVTMQATHTNTEQVIRADDMLKGIPLHYEA